MKNTIKISKGGVEKHLLLDNISSIVVKPVKPSNRYKWFDKEVRYSLFGLFKTTVREGVYDIRYKDTWMDNYAYLDLLDTPQYGYFLKDGIVYSFAEITFNLNNGHYHTFTYNNSQQGEFNNLVEELQKLVNVVVEVK